MTPEQQRIAIAKACGWTGVGVSQPKGTTVGGFPPCDCDDDCECWSEEVPDYLNDLNAMHEAEKVLTIEQTRDYLYELERVTKGHASAFVTLDQAMRLALLVHATTAQRAEAFLRTLNLWNPEQ